MSSTGHDDGFGLLTGSQTPSCEVSSPRSSGVMVDSGEVLEVCRGSELSVPHSEPAAQGRLLGGVIDVGHEDVS